MSVIRVYTNDHADLKVRPITRLCAQVKANRADGTLKPCSPIPHLLVSAQEMLLQAIQRKEHCKERLSI